MFGEPFNITTYSFQHMENNFHKTERALDEGGLHRREARGSEKPMGVTLVWRPERVPN